MIYLRIAVVSLALLILSFSFVYAGDVLFETVISRFYSWIGSYWGSSFNGGFTYTQSVLISYRPSIDQEVCTIKAGLYKLGSPTDSVVMTVRTGAIRGFLRNTLINIRMSTAKTELFLPLRLCWIYWAPMAHAQPFLCWGLWLKSFQL